MPVDFVLQSTLRTEKSPLPEVPPPPSNPHRMGTSAEWAAYFRGNLARCRHIPWGSAPA